MPSPPSTLILILDTHPLSWHLLSHLPPAPPAPDNKVLDTAKSSPTSLHQFITILIVFLNAHLASKWGNEVVVYTASAGKATLIYPPSNDRLRQRGEGAKPNANVYRPFQVLDERIEEGLKEAVREEQQKLDTEGPGFINEPPAMVSALTKALCCKSSPKLVVVLFADTIVTSIVINRRILSPAHNDPTALPPSSDPNNNTADTSGGLLPSKEVRIFVISATPGAVVGSRANADGGQGGGGIGAEFGDEDGAEKDNGDANEEERRNQRRQQRMRGGYVGLMNCVFAAQKAASCPFFCLSCRVYLTFNPAESPDRYSLPSSIYDRFFPSRLLTTSRPSDRRSVLAMEWKRGFASVSSCTFLFPLHRLMHLSALKICKIKTNRTADVSFAMNRVYISHRLLFDIIRSSHRHRMLSTFVQCVSVIIGHWT